jgi:hypothetical protein
MRYALVIAVACGGDPQSGGPCEYAAFHTTCHFVEAERTGDGVTLWFATEPRVLRRDLRVDLNVPAARQSALETFLRKHPDAPCDGQRVVSGTCTPLTGTVMLPAIP